VLVFVVLAELASTGGGGGISFSVSTVLETWSGLLPTGFVDGASGSKGGC
jgi:hypothetical protein